jgi:glycosyltransferase involved in cell wall biosynthesis
MSARRPQIAFWFRYGPAEHTELCHAIPRIIEELNKRADVHYYGLRGPRPTPQKITSNATVHTMPFNVDRTSTRDKFVKTAIWIALLPFIALRCKMRKIDAVYIDETIPLTPWIARTFFGPRVVVTVADFFVDIYLTKPGWKASLGRWLREFDLKAWRKLPAIMTRAKATREFLAKNGIDPACVHPIYDPCDMTIYRPVDRLAARKRFGYSDQHVVLMHHGILHPNKGNDRILRSLAKLKTQLPQLRYLLVGDGAEMENLRALAKELGIEDIVQFTGWLPKLSDVNEAINAGDIGLVMRVGQQSDDFHMTGALVHSMACGLPVLAAKLGGVSEVVTEDENGLMFPPDQMEIFETKLTRLAGDAGLRKRLGIAALEKSRQCFDMKAVTEQTAEMILNVATQTIKR